MNHSFLSSMIVLLLLNWETLAGFEGASSPRYAWRLVVAVVFFFFYLPFSFPPLTNDLASYTAQLSHDAKVKRRSSSATVVAVKEKTKSKKMTRER